MVAADAVLDPDMAPKPALARTVEMATPPGKCPSQRLARLNNSLARPPLEVNSAIKINIGIVVNIKLATRQPAKDPHSRLWPD